MILGYSYVEQQISFMYYMDLFMFCVISENECWNGLKGISAMQ